MIELLPLTTYSFVMSVTPGPNNVLLTASGATFGYRRSLPHILGIGIGSSVQTFLVCLGLGILFQSYPAVQLVLKVVGAVYLLYLAWKLVGAPLGHGGAKPVSFWEAAAFQFVNPKVWVKSITIATLLLPPGMELWRASLYVFAITLLVNFPCVSLWALFGVGIRHFLTDDRRRFAFNGVMALLLVATVGFIVI